MLSGLRNFFLALFISLIVFGISAYFLLGYINQNINDIIDPTDITDTSNIDEENTEYTQTTDETDDVEDIDLSEFTAVILGIDDGKSQHDEKKEADTVFLININAKTKTFMISPLPSDMKTEVKGYTLRLGAVYAEYDVETVIQTVRAYTGLKVDYFCVFDYESIKEIFDILGEIEYTVPMDMYYKPKPYYYDETTTAPATDKPADNNVEETTDPEIIDLKSGKQMIDGEKAVQLLRYRDYSNGNLDRIITQVDFIKEVMRQKITFENLGNAKKIYTEIKKSVVETNMDEKTFEKYADTIFSLSSYTIVEVSYPGTERYENGISFLSPSIKEAIALYKNYRKAKYDLNE